MKTNIRTLFLALAVLATGTLASAQSTTRVTFHVKCGSQGILDAPYSFVLEYTDPCDPLHTIRKHIKLPNRASSEGIAGALAAELNLSIDNCNGTIPPAASEEVDEGGGENGQPTESDILKKHCLVIPKSLGNVNISACREGSDGPGGQLEVTEEQRGD
jgi:hypothetical protein